MGRSGGERVVGWRGEGVVKEGGRGGNEAILHHAPLIPAGMNPFRWNPQEWHRNPQEWAGIHRNGTGMDRNGTGMD